MGEQWRHDTFDCMADMGNCLCGWCCGLCQVYSNAEKLGENGWICCLTALCITPLVPIFVLRKKTREIYGIEGSDADDCICSCCCGCCVSVQVANELDTRGAPNPNGGIINREPKY